MARKRTSENKAVMPVEDKHSKISGTEKPQVKQTGKVRVKVLPHRGVGGLGGPGKVGFIDRKYAEELVADGYVEIIDIK
ncbi:MAG: hypothetical protein HN413_08020 [Chloroflexi bacterium]|nr:hypothetical protein [Chloroflexota bacterium]